MYFEKETQDSFMELAVGAVKEATGCSNVAAYRLAEALLEAGVIKQHINAYESGISCGRFYVQLIDRLGRVISVLAAAELITAATQSSSSDIQIAGRLIEENRHE